MRARRLLFAGCLVVALSCIGALSFNGRAKPIALSMGVASYVRQADDILAYITLTNRGNVSIAVPLRYGCEVEGAGGSTNYAVDTSSTIFLKPKQMVVFSSTNYAVPLPPDTKAWTLKLKGRQQSRSEWLMLTLHRLGVGNSRVISRLSGRPKKDETFGWTEFQSGSFEVAPSPAPLE